jgi:plastocyanin
MRDHYGRSGSALALISVLALFGVTAPSDADAAKRTITMAAVELKGGTTIDKTPFPTASLPEGKGYELKSPAEDGRWEVSAYRWEPSQIIVSQGDEVTLEIIGVNGAEHHATIEGYDIDFTVKRGELTTVTFVADKAGVFALRCGNHLPSMVGEVIVLVGN